MNFISEETKEETETFILELTFEELDTIHLLACDERHRLAPNCKDSGLLDFFTKKDAKKNIESVIRKAIVSCHQKARI